MTSRFPWFVALIIASLSWALPANGEGLIDFIQSIPKDTARRNCWPTPFVYPDRQAAREPFVNMVANGWQHQNMIIGDHFDVETGKLNEAGQAKVLWVLNDAPPQHRSIFVHRAATPQETVAHIQAVQQFIAKSVPPNEFPLVFESTQSADGFSGDRYDVVIRKYQQAAPDPKLMAVDSSGGGGSSGGSGGGGSSGH